MNLRFLVMWSLTISFFSVAAIGMWQPNNGVYFDPSAAANLPNAVAHASMNGGGHYSISGILFREGEFLSVRSLSGKYSTVGFHDYRMDEFSPSFVPVLDSSIVFECFVFGLECYSEKVVARKSVSVDADVNCAPYDNVLGCRIILSPSVKSFKSPVYPSPPAEAPLSDLQMFAAPLFDERGMFVNQYPPFFLFTGMHSSVNSSVLINLKMAFWRNAVEKTRFGIQENQMYGIPFFDGTRSLAAHEAYLLARVQAPREVEIPSAPTLQKVQIKRFYYTYIPGRDYNDGYLFDSMFVQSLEALAYPAIRSTYYDDYFLESSSGVSHSSTDIIALSTGALLWERRGQGNIVDRVRRLETLYFIQHGFSEKQKAQRIANAALWLQFHPDVESVAVDEFLISDEQVSISNAALQAGVGLFFDEQNSDSLLSLHSDGDVIFNKNNVRFYWIVKRNALKNGYDVMARRTPQSEENVP